MNEIKPYIGIITIIVIFSTMINILFISPKRANARDNTFKISHGGCLSDPYVANGMPVGISSGTSLSSNGYFSFVGDGLLDVGTFFDTNNTNSMCKQGDVATGIGLTRVHGGTIGFYADGLAIVLICCTPAVLSFS